MSGLDYAVIGNCSFGALIDPKARIVWACLPRFDSDPVFCSLLNADDDAFGIFDVELVNFDRARQEYLGNTAIVSTILNDDNGGSLQVIDFAPRFKQFDRLFRPMVMVRHIRPVSGTPRIRIRLRPVFGHGVKRPERTRGSNHIRYVGDDLTLRLTTDAPITYVADEIPFVLERPLTLILGPDESLHTGPDETGKSFFQRTREYWHEWCRYLALPFEWQDAVIRAAITLKLCNFEETGAIVAALTTSIPEAPDSGRNWDYRFCWLRDSFFVVHVLNRLGATATMEGYLSYIANLVAASDQGYLQPVYGVAHEADLTERRLESLKGFRGMGPVNVGNNAYAQVQNDGYGSVVLASAQMFFDRRLIHPGGDTLFHRLERLGEQAAVRWNQSDAGPWELRTRADVHTYSSLMCWAACDRLSRIATQMNHPDRSAYWSGHATTIRDGILSAAWNEKEQSFAATFGGDAIDASMLIMPELGFIAGDDPRFLGTLAAAERHLRHGKHLYRYHTPDDFGLPETAFNVCTFWYIDALVRAGRPEEARDMFEHMLACRNSMGLYSEDIDPCSDQLWGNLPQTYSMVGLINSAMRLSIPWERAF